MPLYGELRNVSQNNNIAENRNQPRYRWPWVVLGLVLLGIVLAVLWMSKEVARARRIHDLNAPSTTRIPTS